MDISPSALAPRMACRPEAASSLRIIVVTPVITGDNELIED